MTREEAIEVLNTYDMSEDNDDTEFKGAIALAIKALEKEPCKDCISREWIKTAIHNFYRGLVHIPTEEDIQAYIDVAPSVKPQEQKTGWNNHQIACMLADLFSDACACNYNGIDEWLPELCDFKDTCCPHPVGVACWEQFLKHSQSRYTECGYEVRDKNALQEPKTDGDCISRKAVLDTLDTADKFLDENRTVERYKAILTDAYEVLPSVNPQETKTEPCEDCVSREQAKAEIRKAFPSLADRVDINSILNELPSVQPKTGHWIVEIWNNREHHTCSECNHVVDYEPCYHYCPYCGAEMEEVKE